jgi:hypothetical protein
VCARAREFEALRALRRAPARLARGQLPAEAKVENKDALAPARAVHDESGLRLDAPVHDLERAQVAEPDREHVQMVRELLVLRGPPRPYGVPKVQKNVESAPGTVYARQRASDCTKQGRRRWGRREEATGGGCSRAAYAPGSRGDVWAASDCPRRRA